MTMSTTMTQTNPERPAVAPRVDVYESKDELLLVADLPGVERDGLTLHLDGDRLDIEAVRRPEHAGTPLVREARRYDYRRSFTLPDGIDRDQIAAELANGVLTLRLPKSAAVKPRRIAVKAA
jgi:HSP20 family molecular chaperone IbpA